MPDNQRLVSQDLNLNDDKTITGPFTTGYASGENIAIQQTYQG